MYDKKANELITEHLEDSYLKMISKSYKSILHSAKNDIIQKKPKFNPEFTSNLKSTLNLNKLSPIRQNFAIIDERTTYPSPLKYAPKLEKSSP